MNAYRLTCRGGPFDGRTINYPGLPKVIVLMGTPLSYHDYRRDGDTNIYHYIDKRGNHG